MKTINKNNIAVSCFYAAKVGAPCPIPFAESYISAGFPSSAENHTEKSLDLNDLMVQHPASTFFIRVIGDSMINAHIMPNDILVVDRSLSLTHNKIAVVRINDEFTVKRLHIDGKRILLVAENERYKPIEVTADMDFELFGIVTFVIHQT